MATRGGGGGGGGGGLTLVECTWLTFPYIIYTKCSLFNNDVPVPSSCKIVFFFFWFK